MPTEVISRNRKTARMNLEEVFWLILVPLVLIVALKNFLWALLGNHWLENIPTGSAICEVVWILAVAFLMTWVSENGESQSQLSRARDTTGWRVAIATLSGAVGMYAFDLLLP